MSNEAMKSETTEGAAWLLTVNDWYATRTAPGAKEYTHRSEQAAACYATGSLTTALEKLAEYERLFMQRYPMSAITLRLLSFALVPAGTDPAALLRVGVTHLDESITRLREELSTEERNHAG